MLKRIFSGLVVSTASLVMTLLLVEVALRVLGVGEDSIMQPDPRAGWINIPSRRADILSEDRSLGHRLTIRINALGLRDVDRRLAKPPGTYRVLMLGDSFVEAQQVPLDSALTRRLERALNRPGGRRVEVWNCGMNGYTTSQELLYLENIAAGYHADLVVLCFLSGNDLADEVPQLATSVRNRPFFRLTGDSLVLDRSYFAPDSPPVGWLRMHSRLFTWASTQKQILRMILQRRAAMRAATPAAIPPDFQIYAERPDSLWRLAWNLTERLIVATRDEARRQGAAFMLVSISNGAQESARARVGWPGWDESSPPAGVSLDEPERHLAALAAARGLDYLPLLEPFRDETARTGRPLHIDWTKHWNSAGHALAARVIGERIAAQLTRSPAPRP